MRNKLIICLILLVIVVPLTRKFSFIDNESKVDIKVATNINEEQKYIIGRDLNKDTSFIANKIYNSLKDEKELSGKDLEYVNEYLNKYHTDFYSQESYKKYNYNERFIIDDIWLSKTLLDSYFREKKENKTVYLEAEKKNINEITTKYISQ